MEGLLSLFRKIALFNTFPLSLRNANLNHPNFSSQKLLKTSKMGAETPLLPKSSPEIAGELVLIGDTIFKIIDIEV